MYIHINKISRLFIYIHYFLLFCNKILTIKEKKT